MAGELWRLDGVALAALIRAGKVSAREAVTAHLERLHAVNPRINAVVRTLDEQALAEADAADRALRSGEPLGSLHGLPVTTKVNSDQAGLPTDNGVEQYRDLIAAEDSPQVGSLRRAGAIVIGRTNTPAFSMRGQTENRLHGRTLNPWNPAVHLRRLERRRRRVAGGRHRRHRAGQRHRRLDPLAGLLQRRRRPAPEPRPGRILQRHVDRRPADVRPVDGRQRPAHQERPRRPPGARRDGGPRRQRPALDAGPAGRRAGPEADRRGAGHRGRWRHASIRPSSRRSARPGRRWPRPGTGSRRSTRRTSPASPSCGTRSASRT